MEGRKHIVLVDDDPAILDAIRMALEMQGYKITTYLDGRALLEQDLVDADLFILDKQLPGMDGLDVCRHLKSRSATARIPVLMLSASPKIRELAKAACADEFMEKPFKMGALRSTVQKLMTGA